jgi:hypothetical protein
MLEISKGIKFNESKRKGLIFDEMNLHLVTKAQASFHFNSMRDGHVKHKILKESKKNRDRFTFSRIHFLFLHQKFNKKLSSVLLPSFSAFHSHQVL